VIFSGSNVGVIASWFSGPDLESILIIAIEDLSALAYHFNEADARDRIPQDLLPRFSAQSRNGMPVHSRQNSVGCLAGGKIVGRVWLRFSPGARRDPLRSIATGR
jgi:hypothetical protein